MIPIMRAMSIKISTISIQNLWGFLIFYTIPLSCLFDLNKSSFTLSTSSVNYIIFLSDYFISYPVIKMFYFHVFNPLRTYYIYLSISSSTFCHCFIFDSYISVGSSPLVCFDAIRLLFFGFPGSSNCSLISV